MSTQTSIFVNPDNLNVGIGTQTLNATFHISANSNIPAMVIDQAGTGSLLDVRDAGVSKVIIDGTGNVGIGTTLPTTSLHVRANTTTPGVVIDQAGTGNILDVRDANDSKMVIDAAGNVGIGTTLPTTSLHVRANTTTNGVIIDNASTGNIMDIRNANVSKIVINSLGNIGIGAVPDRNLRVAGNVYFDQARMEFLREGAYDAIRIGTSAGSGGPRLYIFNASGGNTAELYCYSINKSVGSFDIIHPTLPEKRLVHSFVEGPRCDNIYRGEVSLVNGVATVNLDRDCTHLPESAMTEGTFVALNRHPTVYLQNKTTFERVRYEIAGNQLTILCENTNSAAIVSWMVVAERKDDGVKEWGKTNPEGYLITEHDKETRV